MSESKKEQKGKDQKSSGSQQDRLYRAYLQLFGKSETLEQVEKDPSSSGMGWEKNPLFQAYRKLFSGDEKEPSIDGTSEPPSTPSGPSLPSSSMMSRPGQLSLPVHSEVTLSEASSESSRSAMGETVISEPGDMGDEDPISGYRNKLEELKSYGYDVSKLEPLLESDIESFKRMFFSFIEGVFVLKVLSRRIDDVREYMTPNEIEFFDSKINQPDAIPELEWALTEIEARSQLEKAKKEVKALEEEKEEEALAAPAGPAADQKEGITPTTPALKSKKVVEVLTEMGMPDHPAETMAHTPLDPYSLTPGLSYIIERDRPDECFSAYACLLASGMVGICITRTNPKVLRKKYALQESKILWLTDREIATEPTISPELEFLFNELETFITHHPDGVILLDGLEYLISNNEFRKIQRFIRELIDEVSEHEGLLLLPVSPYAIDTKNLKLLEREMEVY